MSQTIIAKSDQLNSDDLLAGPRTITITRVSANPDSPEQPVTVAYEGDSGRPYKPCKSMRRVMVAVWGSDATQYVGRSMTLYRDPEVQFGGMRVGGLRISHMSHMDEDRTLALMATKGRKAIHKVRRLETPKPPAPAEPEPMSPDEIDGALERSRLAAQQGTETFRAFWTGTLTKDERKALAGHLDSLKATAAEADAKGAPTETDPFGLEGADA